MGLCLQFVPGTRACHAAAQFFETAQLTHVRRGEARPATPEAELNRDLRPRDEYFLNDG